MFDIRRVRAKSLHQGVFGLARILLFADFAADTINQVTGLASDIFFTGVGPATESAGNSACSVQIVAISA